MKRFLTLVLLIFVVLYALADRGTGGEEKRKLSRIGDALGLDLSDGALLRFEDSHGGFQGDGLTAAEISIDGLDEKLEDIPGWRPLPMSKNAAEALRNCRSLDGAANGAAEQGWYYFYNRHRDSGDPYDDTGLCGPNSWNFTMAVYDSRQGWLCFYKLDT